jgi:hypothetical protein
LKLLGEFERREGYAGWGIVSCAHWLSWKCGLSLVAARERCRIARALVALPRISDAMRRGTISYCKVRAITRVATPENEGTLLHVAEHGTVTHVERTVRLYRRTQRADELKQAVERHRERSLQWHIDHGGSFVIRGRLTPEQGVQVRKALEAAASELRAQEDASREARAAQSKEEREDEKLEAPHDAPAGRCADALVLIAESFLARGAAALAAGDRHLVTIHVDEAVLRDDANDGRCELEDVSSLPAATVRRLCRDASLVAIVEDADGAALNVGRTTRVVPPAMQRALATRDVGCRYPACSNTRYVDAHHIKHWADGGETRLENLALLWRRHHRFVHAHGFGIRRAGDRLQFVRPDGQWVPDVPRDVNVPAERGRRASQMVSLGKTRTHVNRS